MVGVKIKKRIDEPTPYPYGKISDARSEIRDDLIIRQMEPREVYDKYSKLCVKPSTYESFLVLTQRWGVTKARKSVKAFTAKSIQKGKQRVKAVVKYRTESVINEVAKQRASKLATTEVVSQRLAEKLIKAELKGGDKHIRRMGDILDKAHKTIEGIKVVKKDELLGYLEVADKFDKLGRRLHNLDDQKPLNSQQLNIAILLNSEEIPMSDQSTDEVIDLEDDDLSEEDLLGSD